MGHSYDKIAAALGISDSQVERDLIAAMDAIIREPAERVFAIDMRRLDEMLAGHYDAACNGDPTATAACLRIIEMRGRMLGFFDNERRARLNLNITDNASGGCTAEADEHRVRATGWAAIGRPRSTSPTFPTIRSTSATSISNLRTSEVEDRTFTR
jgi:hypothetical protein